MAGQIKRPLGLDNSCYDGYNVNNDNRPEALYSRYLRLWGVRRRANGETIANNIGATARSGTPNNSNSKMLPKAA